MPGGWVSGFATESSGRVDATLKSGKNSKTDSERCLWFALVFISFLIQLVYIFAVVTLTEFGIAIKPLLEADAIVLLAFVALAVTSFAHEQPFLNFLELVLSAQFSCLRVIIFTVSAGTRRGIALGRPLQTHAVLLRASSILARAWLHIIGNQSCYRRRSCASLWSKNVRRDDRGD